MKLPWAGRTLLIAVLCLLGVSVAHADTLSITSGNNATTTPNVATSITGFQIVGSASATTPLKIHATSGTLHVSTVSGVTMSGNDSSTINLSGTVANLNTALSSLTYSRSSTGTDTLEVALVNSDQIYFSTNGHVYQYVASSLSWNAAKTAAEALTAYGATGYLVTITSSAENDFVKARLSGDAWIGASDVTTEGDWKWVTGPEAGTSFWSGASGGHTVNSQYASWGGGEPNDSGGNEDCGEEYVASGSWNDLPCSGTTISGYVAEFGSDANPATVVSKNISVVTADVPAVTSLSPANGAATVSPTANISITFSKTVTAGSGNILIKKASDDSTVESIAVGSGQVTGGGSSTITIDPSVTLDEGTQYYVIIPSTGFKDASDNYFDGITSSTTWVFTTSDVTPPTLSSITASSTTTTTGTVTWTTNEAASSKVIYFAGTTYASSTSETDTSSRVTSHTKSLSGLAACTSYYYKVVSADAAGNYATSTGALFTTIGCPGGAAPSSATSTTVAVNSAATSNVSDSGRTLVVSTPANFTTASTSVVIQIKGMPSGTVLGSIGTPATSLQSAASVVFDVTALVDNITTVDSFDAPVTISYTYTDEDISGLNESTLSMYHYHGGAWVELDDCSVDAAANTITCSAPSFSTFAIFGTPPAGKRGGGGSIQEQVKNLAAFGDKPAAEALMKKWYWLFPASSAAAPAQTASVRDLSLGMTGEDIRSLQKLLNASGYVLAPSGPGSPGNETDRFGALTRSALARYQKAKGIAPALGYFGPLTRQSMKAAALAGLWW